MAELADALDLGSIFLNFSNTLLSDISTKSSQEEVKILNLSSYHLSVQNNILNSNCRPNCRLEIRIGNTGKFKKHVKK
jgi:hypothetical protein